MTQYFDKNRNIESDLNIQSDFNGVIDYEGSYTRRFIPYPFPIISGGYASTIKYSIRHPRI